MPGVTGECARVQYTESTAVNTDREHLIVAVTPFSDLSLVDENQLIVCNKSCLHAGHPYNSVT